MVEEIDKRTSGQLQQNVKKLWQQDCDRNADISKRRWESRNAQWLTNYGEGFKKKYEDKNPYIKQEGSQQTYAQIVANNNDRNQSPRGPSRYPVPARRPAVNQTQQLQQNQWQLVPPRRGPQNRPPRSIPPNTSGTPTNNIPSLSSGNNLTNQYRNDNQSPNGGPRRSDQNRRSEAPLNAGFPSTNNLSNEQVNTDGNSGRQYFFGTRSETSMEPITEKDQTENDIKIINLPKRKLSDNEKMF